MSELKPVSQGTARLWLPQLSLTGCIRGVMVRDTTGVSLPDERRFNHYPATPMCSISWWFTGDVEMVAANGKLTLDTPRAPAPARVAFSGPWTRPSVTWSTGPAHGMMLLMLPDAFQQLTGIEPGYWLNRMVAADAVLPPPWRSMCASVAAVATDGERVRTIEDFLAPLWLAARPAGMLGMERYIDWVQGLALRAATSRSGRSLRQIERRVREWTGQPLRELRGFGRAEQAFFEAMSRLDLARADWAGLAEEAGYSDQSHLCRVTRRMTGFSPEELRRRIQHDEGFWSYRIWR